MYQARQTGERAHRGSDIRLARQQQAHLHMLSWWCSSNVSSEGLPSMAIAGLLEGDQVGCSVMGGMDGCARRGLREERRALYTHAKERMIHQFLLQINSGEDEEERSRIRPIQREISRWESK
jgi:hypothetical protein